MCLHRAFFVELPYWVLGGILGLLTELAIKKARRARLAFLWV